MTKLSKILFGVLAFMVFLVLLYYGVGLVNAHITTNRIKSVASELPKFNGASIATGERGFRECYQSAEKLDCPSITLKETLDDKTGWQRANEFIEASKNNGVKWSNFNTQRGYIDSNGFERGKHVYYIDIEKIDNRFWVSVVEYL